MSLHRITKYNLMSFSTNSYLQSMSMQYTQMYLHLLSLLSSSRTESSHYTRYTKKKEKKEKKTSLNIFLFFSIFSFFTNFYCLIFFFWYLYITQIIVKHIDIDVAVEMFQQHVAAKWTSPFFASAVVVVVVALLPASQQK